MNMTDRFEFDLQLFADGAAAGESGTAEGTNTGVTEAAAALQNNGRKNPLANVQYGIQDGEQPPVAEAEEKARTLTAETEAKCRAMVAQAEAETREFWDMVSQRLEHFYAEHAGLRELLSLDKLNGGAHENADG